MQELRRAERLDAWGAKQRERVERLPRALCGTILVAALAFGGWQIANDRGVMSELDDLGTFKATIGAVVFNFFGGIILLWLISLVWRPSNLPGAKVR